jgi:hypothetical protein
VGGPTIPDAVWSQSLVEPLGPDRCLSDPGKAPCLYWHLKYRALASYALPERALAFIGFDPAPAPTDGWRYLVLDDHVDRPELEPADAAMLQRLMSVDVSRSMSAFLER